MVQLQYNSSGIRLFQILKGMKMKNINLTMNNTVMPGNGGDDENDDLGG